MTEPPCGRQARFLIAGVEGSFNTSRKAFHNGGSNQEGFKLMSKHETNSTMAPLSSQDSGLSTATGSLPNNRRDLPRCTEALKRRQRSNQQSADFSISKSDQVSDPDEKSALPMSMAQPIHSLNALQPLSPSTPRRQSSSRSGTRRRTSKKPDKRKGGWRKTTGLKWEEVKSIHAIFMALSKARKRLTMFVSIRPPSHIIDDAKRKKLCYRQASHLAQKFRRLGLPFIAIRVFEKDIGGLLHLHLLVHVPRRWLNNIACWSDGLVTHMCPAVRKHVSYITKQRHP